jgi:hypothetical protein
MKAVVFKECTIWGDMGSDSAADQYPQVVVCTDCIEVNEGEDSPIVTVGRVVTGSDLVCALCDFESEEA